MLGTPCGLRGLLQINQCRTTQRTYVGDSAESPDGGASVHVFLSRHVLGQTKKDQISYREINRVKSLLCSSALVPLVPQLSQHSY